MIRFHYATYANASSELRLYWGIVLASALAFLVLHGLTIREALRERKAASRSPG